MQSFDAGFWYVNQPPTVSTIPTQTTPTNTATGAIPFTIGDFETATASLAVTATSNNQTLVPDANIVLGGSGPSRTVTITPAAGQSGTAQITIHVSDGTNTTDSSFIIGVGISIAGTVNYGIVAQGPKVVPHALLTAAGTPGTSSSTDLSGNYSLIGLSGGPYTVTPSKTGDVNGITGFDATVVLRDVAAGGTTLTSNQRIAADTNGSASVTGFDATQILRYVAAAGATSGTGLASTWVFNPSSRSYPSLSGSLASENYDGMLVGEVDGSWTPPASLTLAAEEEIPIDLPGVTVVPPTQIAKPAGEASAGAAKVDSPSVLTPMTVSLPASTQAAMGSTVTIPVTLANPGNNDIADYSVRGVVRSNGAGPCRSGHKHDRNAEHSVHRCLRREYTRTAWHRGGWCSLDQWFRDVT